MIVLSHILLVCRFLYVAFVGFFTHVMCVIPCSLDPAIVTSPDTCFALDALRTFDGAYTWQFTYIGFLERNALATQRHTIPSTKIFIGKETSF